jgi:hypothetical protein
MLDGDWSSDVCSSDLKDGVICVTKIEKNIDIAKNIEFDEDHLQFLELLFHDNDNLLCTIEYLS